MRRARRTHPGPWQMALPLPALRIRRASLAGCSPEVAAALADLRVRLAALTARHLEAMAIEAVREAFGEALLYREEARRQGVLDLPMAPVPTRPRQSGPAFEGAAWAAAHGIDWADEAREALAGMYADVIADTWISIETARELGADIHFVSGGPVDSRTARAGLPSGGSHG